jgi:PAS domain S-box-containing protein
VVSSRWALQRNAQGEPLAFLEINSNITARRRAEAALEASEAQLRLVTDSVPVFLAHCDAEGRYRFVNRGYAERFGLSREQIIGRRIPDVLGAEVYARFQPYFERALAGESVEFDVEIPYQVIGPRWMHCAYAPESDEAGAVRGVIAVIADMTVRKRMEAQLEASLQEKEVLLKEIHHRVKNNLQIVASLLSLQRDVIKDPQVLTLFEESERRIGSMALVHETLYQTGDLTAFHLTSYVRTLTAQLLHAYGVDANRIAVRLELADVELPLDMAVPCGLILNELVANCLKHAFPDEQAGELTVTLTQEEDHVCLTVKDDGCGFPEQLDFRHTESLGLQLVCALAEQLEGTIVLERHGGTAFTLTFPLPTGSGDKGPTAAVVKGREVSG